MYLGDYVAQKVDLKRFDACVATMLLPVHLPLSLEISFVGITYQQTDVCAIVFQ